MDYSSVRVNVTGYYIAVMGLLAIFSVRHIFGQFSGASTVFPYSGGMSLNFVTPGKLKASFSPVVRALTSVVNINVSCSACIIINMPLSISEDESDTSMFPPYFDRRYASRNVHCEKIDIHSLTIKSSLHF